MDRKVVQQHGFTAFCVAVATTLRYFLGLLWPDITVFATYYPAALVATLVCSVPAGITATPLTAVSAWWLFLLPPINLSRSNPPAPSWHARLPHRRSPRTSHRRGNCRRRQRVPAPRIAAVHCAMGSDDEMSFGITAGRAKAASSRVAKYSFTARLRSLSRGMFNPMAEYKTASSRREQFNRAPSSDRPYQAHACRKSV